MKRYTREELKCYGYSELIELVMQLQGRNKNENN